MNFKDVFSIIWITFSVSAAPQDIDVTLDLKSHLEIFEEYRNPLGESYGPWISARDHIIQKFQSYGLLMKTQEFETKIATWENSVQKVTGVNVIGVSVSSKEVTDPVILIGASYDSSLQRNPLVENGAAMASLLETAKIFQKHKANQNFVQNCSVIFVAFDINTKTYVPYGPGKPGSVHFVENFLPEFLAGRKFLGAIILDSVSIFNPQNNTQVLIDGFHELFPDPAKNIESRGNKGDFLALISRGDSSNLKLSLMFATSYSNMNKTEWNSYRLEKLLIPDGVKIPPAFVNFLNKRSQSAFWKASLPFPAVLISDLDITRKPPEGDKCATLCEVETFLTDTRRGFVEKTTEALIRLLINLQTSSTGQWPTTVPTTTTDQSDSTVSNGSSSERTFAHTIFPFLALLASPFILTLI